MTQHNYRDQVLAFAGIWQAIALVQHVARRGMADAEDFETCIKSLFVTDPPTTDDVYGSTAKLTKGLTVLLNQFGEANNYRDMELTKYVIALMHLERRLAKHPEMLAKIGQELEATKSQVDHFGAYTHENIIAHLADIYSATLSTLPPKIIVSGEEGRLSNPTNAAKVRALLLAGVRSTVLWYQLGGRRMNLLFSRRKLLKQAKSLLNENN